MKPSLVPLPYQLPELGFSPLPYHAIINLAALLTDVGSVTWTGCWRSTNTPFFPTTSTTDDTVPRACHTDDASRNECYYSYSRLIGALLRSQAYTIALFPGTTVRITRTFASTLILPPTCPRCPTGSGSCIDLDGNGFPMS